MDNPSSFPAVIDSSMRSQFVACPHSFFRRYMQGLQRPGTSVHLHFGSCFADGIAAFRRAFYLDRHPTDIALGIAAAEIIRRWGTAEFTHPTKSLETCLGALEAYVAHYPPATDHLKPLIQDDTIHTEFNFGLPLPIRHPVTDEPLLYAGRFDMLGVLHGTGKAIVDEKTTSQLGDTWGNQWRLRAQFTGYAWGAAEFGHAVDCVVVRGISILKRGFGHAEVIEQRPQWMIAEWKDQLLRDIRRMIATWKDGHWDKSLDSACSSYGGCTFLDLCTSEHPDRWMGDYEVSHYDPLGSVE